MMLFAILVVLPGAILQQGAAQQCSCTTGIAVVAQDDLRKEIRTELSAVLAENGVANITMVTMSMVSALLMGTIQESIFGPLLLPTLKVAQALMENVPAQMIKYPHNWLILFSAL